MIIWLTGLPCSGKSTIAKNLEFALIQAGHNNLTMLDGDTFRSIYSKDLGFSPEDRAENIRRARVVALKEEKECNIVIASFVSPYRKMRDQIRSQAEKFIEVYVKADLEVCMDRDIKGMYRKAILGELKEFTGYSAPYEEPYIPEVECKTDYETIDQSVQKILNYITEMELL